MVEDAVGLIILIIAAVVLVMAAGFGLLFSFDLLASAVSWLGQGPALGWTMVGTICGVMFGAVQGMRARGKSDDLRKIYFGAILAVVIVLAASVTSPGGRALMGR